MLLTYIYIYIYIEDREMRIYQALNATHIFLPIAIETSGVFGGEALAFFKDIGYRMRSKTQDPQSFLHLCQQISVCIQQFNSVSVLGSCSMQPMYACWLV